MIGIGVIFSHIILICCLSACGSNKGRFNHYADTNKEDILIGTFTQDSISFAKVRYKKWCKRRKS